MPRILTDEEIAALLAPYPDAEARYRELTESDPPLPAVETMRRELAERDARSYGIEDLAEIFLHGVTGYDEMVDEDVEEEYRIQLASQNQEEDTL